MTEFNRDHVESVQYRSLDMQSNVSNHSISFQTWALTRAQTKEHPKIRCTTVTIAAFGGCW
jgi:hypothetical protein